MAKDRAKTDKSETETAEQPEKEKPSIEDRLSTVEAALAHNQIFAPEDHPGAESAASHADRNAPQPKR